MLQVAINEASRSTNRAEDIRYTLGLWPGLTRFLEEGRMKMRESCASVEGRQATTALPTESWTAETGVFG